MRSLVVAAAAVVALAGCNTAATSAEPTNSASRGHWVGAWTASAQRATGDAGVAADPTYFEPNWSEQGFAKQTVRQVVRVTAGGTSVRIHLSNQYGTSPLRIAAATLARTVAGAAVDPESVRALRFGGADTVTIPPGGHATSDAVSLAVVPREHLTVSLYLDGPTGPATFHYYALATSYLADGDHSADTRATSYTERSHSWYYLVGVDVLGDRPAHRGTIVTFGDSITDGAFSTVDADHRYPDQLADLLASHGHPRAVLNEGSFGNRVLNDSPCFGDNALSRFRRDVLDQPRVSTVVVHEGINDIWMSDADGFSCLEPNPPVTAGDLIRGYRALIHAAHRRDIRVVGGTLLPYGGLASYTGRGEAVREAVNRWIRRGHGFDAVIDFDAVVRDPTDPHRMLPAYDSGDHLHPNDRGYAAMAAATLRVLTRGWPANRPTKEELKR